jgi:PIN domain nuclease of toxin-antitoxin system
VSERASPRGVLLDTCAVIWLANGDPLEEAAVVAIVHAGSADGIFVSPVSAWEVGLLARPGTRRRVPLRFLPDPKTWFTRVMAGPGIKEAPLTSAIAIDASYLPGDLHGDPGDRLIVATGRHFSLPIVTRDRRIIAYAAQGHAVVVPC